MANQHDGKWTEEEILFVKDNYLNMSNVDMAASLPGRNARSIAKKLVRLKLKRPKTEPKEGDGYNRWTILSIFKDTIDGVRQSVARCLCECGIIKDVRLTLIIHNRVRSCGCLQKEVASETAKVHNKKHGLCKHPLYIKWYSMIDRCTNPNNSGYKNYGGRGINVCAEWTNSFITFYNWAMANNWSDNRTIERCDNNDGYCPENCRFIPMFEQGENKRSNHSITAFGETKIISHWAKDKRCKVSLGVLLKRINHGGWNEEDAIITAAGQDTSIKKISAFGESKSARKWEIDPRCKVKWATLFHRVFRYGWNEEAAITTPLTKKTRCKKLLTLLGETKTINEWEDDPRCKVRKEVFLKRISQHGWDVEDAITTPLVNKNDKRPKKKTYQVVT